jgi:hypothetical protein
MPRASPSDLLVVVSGEPQACDEAIEAAGAALQSADSGAGRQEGAAFSMPRTSLALAVGEQPDANLALISVPGDYAAAEAMKALRLGLHVMLFSGQRQHRRGTGRQDVRPYTRPAGDGAGLWNRHRQRRAARLRERGAPRRHRSRRRVGHGAARR